MESPSGQLRIVFMGTPEFAVGSLDILHRTGYELAGVVTAPDKPAGRGLQMRQSAVKDYALDHGLNILQPANLNDHEFLSRLKGLEADLNVVVAFRMLPEAVWSMPRYGSFNLHASLLPQYRGAAPINWALINGEVSTGVTTFFLDKEIDTGSIILREEVPIGPDETAGELHDRLKDTGAALVLKTVRAIEAGDIRTIRQVQLTGDGSNLKKAPKIYHDDCRIDWNKRSYEVHNLIRGLSPYPGAYTTLTSPEGRKVEVKITRSALVKEIAAGHPGSIIIRDRHELLAGAADGFIRVIEVQPSGKRKMAAEEFLRGYPVSSLWSVGQP
jgi:methionyl-tRNA formyltransferase